MRLLAGPVLTRTRSSVALVTYLRPLAELALRPPCPELALPVLGNDKVQTLLAEINEANTQLTVIFCCF